MMLERGTVRLSASDLMRFMSCAHASALDLERLHGRGPDPIEDSSDAILLQRHGDAHEAAHLAALKAEGDVAEIDRDLPFAEAVEATKQALATGARVIFQGALEGGAWGGWSDFLERVERPSALGAFSYEVADTKLKRKPDPRHLLQLALYSDLLAPLQGCGPERAHVLLGDGARATFRLAEFTAYARGARDRLEKFVASPHETRPVPSAACDLCRWRVHCHGVWLGEDSLYQVAGITRSQVSKIEAAGVGTMSALASRAERIPGLANLTLSRLRLQARLQTDAPDIGPHHALLAPAPGKGFDLLPKPDPGDLYYDIEGDPFYAVGGVDGLEYLHGVWDGEDFASFWAHDRAGERDALVDLFAFLDARLRAHPEAHVYHYAAYEITALRRLCARHGVGEAMLDRWLREHRFCDLYAVVRSGVAASQPSYSIKDLEPLYGFRRTGEVKTAGGSVVAYEEWRETGDEAILEEIEHYNRLDCVSTEGLRDWLISIRPEGPWPAPPEEQEPHHDEREEEVQRLRYRLLAADLPEGRGELMFDLAQFHAREAKPAAWAVFEAAGKIAEDLFDDLDCLGGLVAAGPPEPEKRSVKRAYRYPPQETKLRAGNDASILLDGVVSKVSILALDRRARTVSLKLAPSQGAHLPERLDLLPTFAIPAQPIPEAIRSVVADQLGPRENVAADDLLARRAPRFSGGYSLPDAKGVEPVELLIEATGRMDNSVLPVQGPPGTGKTYVTARAILAQVRAGRRVAVSSNSHEAILNVLKGCVDALAEAGGEDAVSIVHKGGRGAAPSPSPYDRIRIATSNRDAALATADVVGGTAWLFSREEMAGGFDYLFVDEAGQVPLANLLAMTNAARNIVLVGDPRQLPQVIQGAHPHPANLSCLEWMLDGATTIPPGRGLFLPVTRRMHPALGGYISEQFYEGRLTSHETTARQSVVAPGLPKTGAWLIPVEHEGRAQDCPEEVALIRRIIDRLAGGVWTERDGRSRALKREDVIVVAPYNAQVNALVEALPGVRVGTVDRFQGQEAPVALVSMTASSAEETSRGLGFLLSRERLNVAVSRGQALSLVLASPRLAETPCRTVEEMRLVNTLAALPLWRMEDMR